MGSNHVFSEPMGSRTVGSDHTSEHPILDENAQGKTELPSTCVIGELVETKSAGSNADQTFNLCDIELVSDNVQYEPVESEVVGSDSTDDGKSGMKTMIIDSAAHDNQKTESSNQEQSTSEKKLEPVPEHGTSEPMDIMVESSAEEKGNTTGTSLSKENTVAVKPELGSEIEPAEQMAKVAESNAQNFQTLDSLHYKLCSEQIEGKPMETTFTGSGFVEVGLSSSVFVESVPQNCATGSSVLDSNTSDGKLMTGPEHVSSKHMGIAMVGSDAEKSHIRVMQENILESIPENDPTLVHDEAMETSTAKCDAQKFQTIELCSDQQKVPTETKIVGSYSVDAGLSGIPPTGATENSDWTGHKETTASSKSKKRKSALNCTPVTARALRPRVNGLCKTPELVSSSVNANVNGEQEKSKKKTKKTINTLDDEFSRTRKRLRYFLSRMGCEHNFIEAYSGEGWKGQSAEKIRPEKELERATSQILQCKRKIRELFQHLDSSCAEGRFQESLFDSEGLISSDDIFCAKCGSKDVSADNDIILCDGICDRGFHQMCLTPPLLKEEIPPGDEGWLCPGCDCKLDCIEVLNDSQGTDLSMDDSWEKVFPEAGATIVGDMIDEIAGLPSDDSEDNEYNPEASDGDDEVNTESSSSGDSENSENSNDSDSTSDCDDLVTRPIDDQIMGLPSDDSEDDEYDPNAPDPEQPKEEGSSSDSTSASEYFSASSDANESSGAEDDPLPSSVDGSKLPVRKTRRSEMASNENQSVNSELLQILESNSQGHSAPVLGRRRREKLDYKKLHDEEYGNVPTDSLSDDEDYVDTDDAPQMKKDDGIGTRNLEETGSTLMRKKDSKDEMEIDSPAPPGLTEKETTTPTSKALGPAGKERLQESFRENNYPSRDTKENLAKELGVTFKQVTKWFEHARWHSRHRSNNAKSKNNTNVSETTDQVAKLSEETPSKLAEETLSNGVLSSQVKETKEEEAPPSKVKNAVEPPETEVEPHSKVENAEKVVAVEPESDELSTWKSLWNSGGAATPSKSKEEREVVLSLTAMKSGQVQTRSRKASSQIKTRSRPKRKR